MKYFSAFFSFVFVFFAVFFIAALNLTRLHPPVSHGMDSVFALTFEGPFWKLWMTKLLGVVLGGLSARSVLKRGAKKDKGK
jgi:hypothetical protein